MDWSYYLLSEPERVVFRRLSAFSSGFALEAAEAVCAGDGVEASEVLNLVALLVDKSLVLVDAQGEDTRYRLLETVRQYGREKLLEAGEAADVRRRHRDWYLGLAERAEPELVRAEQSAWLHRLEADHDNFREALEWSVEDMDKDAGLRLAGALHLFWSVRGYLSEAREWLERALSGSSGMPTLARAKALHAAGYVASFQHDYDQAAALVEAGLAQFQELGEKRGIARSHFLLGVVALGQDEYERATAQFQQSMTLFGELGDKRGIGISLNQLGEVARCQGDYAAAHALYAEDLALRRELGDERGIGIELHNLGYVARHEGDDVRAIELFKESLAIRLKLGHKVGIAYCLAGLAAVAATRSQLKLAAKLLGAADALLGTLGADMDRPDRLEYDRTVATLRTTLGEGKFETDLREGRVMPLEQAIELALSA
jgi:non-specific serine/threonine protein kinase